MQKELGIFDYYDFLHHFPFRHIDKTKLDAIAELNEFMSYAYVGGRLIDLELVGSGPGRRLVGHLRDHTGVMEVVWFQGVSWMHKYLQVGQYYLAFGRPAFFMGKPQIAHPEMELFTPGKALKSTLEPVYSTTEKLKTRGLSGHEMGRFTAGIFQQITAADLPENLNDELLKRYKLMPRYTAYQQIHFPGSEENYNQALRRLKFEELFLAQLRLQLVRLKRHRFSRGVVLNKVGDFFNDFYKHHLPFQLTSAQKRVIKEIRKDTGSGRQMNRLLQGDVGSGKTIVALLSMLLAADNGFQSVLMAPTEILARQHFAGISQMTKEINVRVEILTGSVKTKERRRVLAAVEAGEVEILIGTHAVIEEKVLFKNLGLAIIDEQHKFGVAQRAKLWKKNEIPPHVLVMTATPIPRTLALTAYGELDYSVMDELPPGRIPVDTFHKNEGYRPQVMDFIKKEIDAGRQAYVIYPLIEESSKVDYENLMKGYQEIKSFFPEPKYWISMVHGRQTPEVKEVNMQRFVSGDTQILVSTTVIEVGVNVTNATVMVIESAEKFGLSQLHQLRGRVGRGGSKSYCILLTGNKLSADARARMKILEETNDGFKVAEKDLEIRGPGEIEGTRQSGEINFKLASIVNDKAILEVARKEAESILEKDPDLTLHNNFPLKQGLLQQKKKTGWSKIS